MCTLWNVWAKFCWRIPSGRNDFMLAFWEGCTIDRARHKLKQMQWLHSIKAYALHIYSNHNDLAAKLTVKLRFYNESIFTKLELAQFSRLVTNNDQLTQPHTHQVIVNNIHRQLNTSLTKVSPEWEINIHLLLFYSHHSFRFQSPFPSTWSTQWTFTWALSFLHKSQYIVIPL